MRGESKRMLHRRQVNLPSVWQCFAFTSFYLSSSRINYYLFIIIFKCLAPENRAVITQNLGGKNKGKTGPCSKGRKNGFFRSVWEHITLPTFHSSRYFAFWPLGHKFAGAVLLTWCSCEDGSPIGVHPGPPRPPQCPGTHWREVVGPWDDAPAERPKCIFRPKGRDCSELGIKATCSLFHQELGSSALCAPASPQPSGKTYMTPDEIPHGGIGASWPGQCSGLLISVLRELWHRWEPREDQDGGALGSWWPHLTFSSTFPFSTSASGCLHSKGKLKVRIRSSGSHTETTSPAVQTSLWPPKGPLANLSQGTACPLTRFCPILTGQSQTDWAFSVCVVYLVVWSRSGHWVPLYPTHGNEYSTSHWGGVLTLRVLHASTFCSGASWKVDLKKT